MSVHDNRAMGVWFIGGDHSLTDAKIWSNPTGILLEPSAPPAVPGGQDNPYLQCRAQFRNLWVKDGAYGLQILNDCSASVQYATFVGQPIGIMLPGRSSRLHLINSIVKASSQSIQSKGIYFGDYNCWSNPKGTFGGRSMHVKDQFQQSKIENHSIYVDPGLDTEDSSRLQADSPVIGRAFVDAEHQAHLRRSHFVRPDGPPTVSQNMGATFIRVP